MKILFFTPFAARNGAEMMLWYLLKNINTIVHECAVYCDHLGPLFSELPVGIKSYIFPTPKAYSLREALIDRVKSKAFNINEVVHTKKTYIASLHDEFKADIWYINTVLCPEAVECAIELGIPYVVHFHDLLFLYQHISYTGLKNAVTKASLLVGCSTKVCDNLKIMGGSNIALQYECVDINAIVVNHSRVEEIKKELQLNGEFVWVMSGSIEYRKGTDIIPELAKELGPNVKILWLGPGSSGYSYFIEKELEFFGLTNVHLLGPKSEDYYDYLSLANGLVLTSREDPFPLVMIEAAAMGKPIVAFNSGGVSEFLKEGMGTVITSFETKQLAHAMRQVASGDIQCHPDVSKERAKEFDAHIQAEKWQEMLLDKMQTSNTGR